MHLSKRLNTIASICQPATVLADVGCDHAYLSIHLVTAGIVDDAIAMDLREGPLKKAAENVKAYGLENRIQLRLGNGLENLEKNEADLVLISGMGGILICDILMRGWNKICKKGQLVLQPQSDLSLVRHFLHDRGMVINKEKMCIDDGKYYTCIHASFGDVEKYENEYEYEYGKLLIDNKDKILAEYISERLKKNKAIISSMEAGGRTEDDETLKSFLQDYAVMSEIYAYVSGE